MAFRRTIQIARIFGIRIGVGPSWFLVLFLYIFLVTPDFHRVLGGSFTTAYAVTVATGLSFFVSLVLHELGHAVVARRNGLQVLGIELWALGGMTRTTGAPDDAGVQFRVAAAGPAATLALIAVSFAVGQVIAPGGRFVEAVADVGAVHSGPVVVWMAWVAALNAMVLLVNLIPAFPLDGSQMAQAVLWRLTGDRNGAARVTGRIGQGLALALGLASLFWLTRGFEGSLWALLLMVFAVFLYQGAGAAVTQGALGQRIQRLTVADIIDREPDVIPGELRLLDAQERFFAHHHRPWFAVVDQARHFLGVVRADRLEHEIAAGRPALAVSDVVEGEDELPLQVREDDSLEKLLRSEALGRWGGVVAVDGEGVLRGVVTVAQIRKALRAVPGR